MQQPSACIRLAYVFAIRSVDVVDAWLQHLAPLAPDVIVRERSVVVVLVRSPYSYEVEPSARHAVIDDDLARLRRDHPGIGGFHPEFDGIAIGNRWPIALANDPTLPTGPGVVSIEAGWDNVVISQADDEVAARLIRLTAITLARYRVLEWCIAACRSLLVEIRGGDNSRQRIDSGIRALEQVRNDAMIARVVTDPRASIYWGCEQRLVEDLYTAWSMSTIEQSASDALATTSVVLAERRADATATSSRQASITLLVLTLISGVSGVASLVEFTASGTELEWMWVPRGVIAIGMVVTFVVLLGLLRARMAQEEPPEP